MRNILFTALTKFLHHQEEHNPHLIADYYNAFSSSIIDTQQALDGLAKLITELGVYYDADGEVIKPELFVNIGLILKNNLDFLHLACRGEEVARMSTALRENKKD